MNDRCPSVQCSREISKADYIGSLGSCPECNTEVHRCRRCETSNASYARFCRACGSELQVFETLTSGSPWPQRNARIHWDKAKEKCHYLPAAMSRQARVLRLGGHIWVIDGHAQLDPVTGERMVPRDGRTERPVILFLNPSGTDFAPWLSAHESLQLNPNERPIDRPVEAGRNVWFALPSRLVAWDQANIAREPRKARRLEWLAGDRKVACAPAVIGGDTIVAVTTGAQPAVRVHVLQIERDKIQALHEYDDDSVLTQRYVFVAASTAATGGTEIVVTSGGGILVLVLNQAGLHVVEATRFERSPSDGVPLPIAPVHTVGRRHYFDAVTIRPGGLAEACVAVVSPGALAVPAALRTTAGGLPARWIGTASGASKLLVVAPIEYRFYPTDPETEPHRHVVNGMSARRVDGWGPLVGVTLESQQGTSFIELLHVNDLSAFSSRVTLPKNGYSSQSGAIAVGPRTVHVLASERGTGPDDTVLRFRFSVLQEN